MNKIFLFLSAVYLLAACKDVQEFDKNKHLDSEAISANSSPRVRSSATTPNCTMITFENFRQQADTLLKYVNKKQQLADEKFFCAFPNSFKEMQNIFGFHTDKGAAPLYDDTDGENVIGYFINLNSISKEVYYDKYINICVGGVWEADNIQDAFGLADRLTNDTEAACSSLSKRTDNEIRSVFHFIFDGPHPKNNYNEDIYARLLPILTKQNERLSKLLTESYNKLMAADDGNGH